MFQVSFQSLAKHDKIRFWLEVIKKEPTWQDGEDSFGDCEESQRFALLGQLGWTVVGVVGSGQDGDEHGDRAVPVQQAQNQEYATDHDEPE